MKTGAPHDVPAHLLENPENHITRTGAFLRRTSIDELPQLFNILSGEMSLVGPRPLLWNQLDVYNARQSSGANNIKPGLTGWAQVNGRDRLTNEEKARFDGEYASHIGFRLDLVCVWRTILVLLRSE